MKTQHAIDHYGSATALADALGVTLPAISQWTEFPPDKRQLQIERLTNGALKAEPECTERLLGIDRPATTQGA